MKVKMAALLGVILCIGCFFANAEKTEAAEGVPGIMNIPDNLSIAPYGAYLQAKADIPVYAGPGTDGQALGTLKKGQPAIAVGKSDNGWIQIYYIGALGYVPGDSMISYETPAQAPWSPVPVRDGMTINMLGDSITYGDKLSDVSQAYSYLVAARLGNAKLNNYGWNGSAIGGALNVDRFLDRYCMMDRSADLVVVFGGTNDYGGYNERGVPVGSPGDMTWDSFYGSLNLLMCGLKQMYPNSRIVFLTPLKRVGYMRKNRSGCYLNQYVTAIQEMAAFYGIPVIDLFNEPELDFSIRGKTYLVDGLHPNAVGHRLIGAYVYNRLFEPF